MSDSFGGNTGWSGYEDSSDMGDDSSWADESSFMDDAGYDDYAMSDDSFGDESYDDYSDYEEAYEDESFEDESEDDYSAEEEAADDEPYDDEDESEEEEQQEKPEEEEEKVAKPDDDAPERHRKEPNPFDVANKNFRDASDIPKLPDFRQGKNISDPLGLENGREDDPNANHPRPQQPQYNVFQDPDGLNSSDPQQRLAAYQFALNIPDSRIQSFTKSNSNWQSQVDTAVEKLADYTAAFQNAFGLSNNKIAQLQEKPGWAKIVDNQIGQMAKTVAEVNHIIGVDGKPEETILDQNQPRGWYSTYQFVMNDYHELIDTYQNAFAKSDADMKTIVAQKGWGTDLGAQMAPLWDQVNELVRSDRDLWRSQVDQYLETHEGWALNPQASLQQFVHEEAAGAYPKPTFDPNPPPVPAKEFHYTSPTLAALENPSAAQSQPAPPPQATPPPEVQPAETPAHAAAPEPIHVEVSQPVHVSPPDQIEPTAHTADEEHPSARTMSANHEEPSHPVHAPVIAQPVVEAEDTPIVQIRDADPVEPDAPVAPAPVTAPPVAAAPPVYSALTNDLEHHLIKHDEQFEQPVDVAPVAHVEVSQPPVVTYQYDPVQGVMAIAPEVHHTAQEWHDPVSVSGKRIDIGEYQAEDFQVHYQPEEVAVSEVYEAPVTETPALAVAPEVQPPEVQEIEPEHEHPRFHHWGGGRGRWDGGGNGHSEY
jgi:hypothetical protein